MEIIQIAKKQCSLAIYANQQRPYVRTNVPKVLDRCHVCVFIFGTNNS